jgi:hypothetical protein
MSKPDSATDAPEPAIDLAVARAQRCLAMLERLAEKGLALAEAVEENGSKESADAFAKLSRAVRLTIALMTKVEEGPRQRTGGGVAQARSPATDQNADPADPYAPLKTGRKAQVRDLVREVIDRETPDAEENDILVDALEERLLCDEAYDDIEGLPLREVVEHLCADLQLKPQLEPLDRGGLETQAALLPPPLFGLQDPEPKTHPGRRPRPRFVGMNPESIVSPETGWGCEGVFHHRAPGDHGGDSL